MVQWQPYALLFLSGALVSSAVGVQALRHRREIPAAGPLALCMVALTEWSLAETVSASLRPIDLQLRWQLLLFPGVSVNVVGFVWLVRTLVDGRAGFRRRTWLLLAVEPVLITALAVTNPWHHLVYASATQAGSPPLLQATGGTAFWLHATYSYGLLGWSVLVLLRHWRSASELFRRQATPILIGMSLPCLLNVVTLAGMTGRGRVDLTVIGFIALSSMTWWTVRRHGLLRFSPVARGFVFDRVTDPLLVLDRNRRLLDLNPAAVTLLRAARPDLPATLVGLDVLDVLPARAPWVTPGNSAQLVLELPDRSVVLDVRTSSLTDRRGTVTGHVVVCRDISALTEATHRLREQLTVIEELQHTLSEQAMRDALTGLHNRRYLTGTMTAQLLQCREAGLRLGVVLIDLDHFKDINDRHGHAVGDDVLRTVARTLAEGIRADDVIARYGGEEFVVVLPGVDARTAARRAQEWLLACGDLRLPTPAGPLSVTFSAGVAAFPQHGTTPEELLLAADRALYRAKDLGRNQVRVAAPPTGPDAAVPAGPSPARGDSRPGRAGDVGLPAPRTR